MAKEDADITLDYSLIGEPGATLFDETVPGSNLLGFDPGLDSLQDNGGATLTHALLPGSPAIDAGDPDFNPPPSSDQRGVGFPRVVGGHIDIGAYEVQPTGPGRVTWAQLALLDDVNYDGTPELAVVSVIDGAPWVTVKDAADRRLLSSFALAEDLVPIGLETIRNDWLVVYGEADRARVDVRDPLSAWPIGGTAFSALRFTPIDLAMIDYGSWSTIQSAMLAQGSRRIEIRATPSPVSM